MGVQEPNRDEWVARFNERRDTFIRPELEALGKQLRARGHDFYIIETPFRSENRAIPAEATIRLDIYLASERTRTAIGTDRRPFLGFSTNHRTQKVAVTVCDVTGKGGSETKIGEFPLEMLDSALIRQNFMSLLRRVLGK